MAIDVGFEAADARLAQAFGLEDSVPIAAVIWTTTPWTLLANEAVCLHPDFEYVLVRRDKHYLVVAAQLREAFCERVDAQPVEAPAVKGAALAGIPLRHPFLDRTVPIITGMHVTADEGTGCVHTAPAHGPEDHAVGLEFDLPVDCPVDEEGRFREDTPVVANLSLADANPHVVQTLEETGRLLSRADHPHSYPHCWRHHTPLFFRTAPQWFIRMEAHDLRQAALQAIDQVQWHPDWGHNRIRGMLEGRPDWCISRQRTWGTPIPLFWHRQTGDLHPDTSTLLEEVAKRIEHQGIDAWFELDPAELLGEEAEHYVKSPDTLDVWFDSGVTHRTVLDSTPETQADLYLEGSDQHRGWFQSSLLTGVALNTQAPYRQVLTHGFVVDAQGYKMSKSRGNIIAPQKVVDRLGADILRLWVASSDTRAEMTVSDEILDRTAEAYRRIRNTARYLLSNLYDFDPATDALPANQLLSLERYILSRAAELDASIREDYANYQFHRISHHLHTFCTNELGSLFLDVTKDRTYTLPANHPARRSAQTAMYELAQVLCRWLAPICPFTADEIYEHLPAGQEQPSVHLCEWWDLQSWKEESSDASFNWPLILEVRQAVSQTLEPMRQNDTIGAALDAEVEIYAEPPVSDALQALGSELKFLFITSAARLCDQPPEGAQKHWLTEAKAEIHIAAAPSPHPKCARCWHHHPSVGTIAEHPQLCARCHSNIEGDGEERRHV